MRYNLHIIKGTIVSVWFNEFDKPSSSQDTRLFHHSRKVPSSFPPQETIDLLSVVYVTLVQISYSIFHTSIWFFWWHHVRFVLSHMSEVCYLLLNMFFVWTTTICSFSCWWTFGLFSGVFFFFFLASLNISQRTEHSWTHLYMNSVFISLG